MTPSTSLLLRGAAKSDGLGGLKAGLSEARLSGAGDERRGRSTSCRVYGSHVVAVDDGEAAPDWPAPGRGCPLQTCVAAFAAAGGAFPLSVVTILLELPRSFCPGLSVFNIPLAFLSGLGVRARGGSTGGVSFGEAPDCRLIVRGDSVSEAFLVALSELFLVRNGLLGLLGLLDCAGRRSSTGAGRGRSA